MNQWHNVFWSWRIRNPMVILGLESSKINQEISRHFWQIYTFVKVTKLWTHNPMHDFQVELLPARITNVTGTLFFSSPGQRPCELLPSLGVRHRLSLSTIIQNSSPLKLLDLLEPNLVWMFLGVSCIELMWEFLIRQKKYGRCY